jgi:tetrahydromethanopterin S-methyltransferase subunit G
MRSKDLRLKLVEELLQDRERDYQGVAARLRVEQDVPNQNQLKNQLEQIAQRMDDLEQKLQHLRCEIQQDARNVAIRGLLHLFESNRFEPDLLRQTYQVTLAARF